MSEELAALRKELAEAHSMVTAHESTIVKQENELAEAKAALEKYWNIAVEAQAMCADTHAALVSALENCNRNLSRAVLTEAALEAANARIAELEEQLQECWQRNLKLSNATTARAERAEAASLESDRKWADHCDELVAEERARAERAEAEYKLMRVALAAVAAPIPSCTSDAVLARIDIARAALEGSAERAEAEFKALREASDRIGFWLSAALDDPGVCDAMKTDIHAWFAALNPSPAGREG